MARRIVEIMAVVAALAAVSAAVAAPDYLAEAERLLGQGQLKAAEIELKNAVQASPQDMLAHYRLAALQLRLGEAPAAEHEARIALNGGYDAERARPLLAETYLAQQKYRLLLEDFPATEGSADERASLLVARGAAQFALEKPEDARHSYEVARSLAPKALKPLLAEAALMVAQRQLAEAGTLYEEALKLDAKSSEARLGKAHLARLQGDAETARSLLDSLLADEPGLLPARLERAEILIAQNLDQPAKADVDAVLAAQPGSVPAIYLQAVLAAKAKNFEAAAADLQKISAAIPLISRGYYVQALVLYNLRQLNQAEDSARRNAARNPNDLAGHKLLAVIELALRRPADAVDALSTFESAGKADAAALDLLGRAYTQLGKTSEALAAFDLATKAAPDNAALRLQLGATRLRAGETEAAIGDIEQSLQLAPSAPAGELLVLTELRAGHWDAAVDAVDKLRQAQPDSPVPDNLAGLIKLERFDLDGAHADFAGLAKRYPEFEPAHLNLALVAELQGKNTDAEDVLRSLLAAHPDDFVALTQLVKLLLRNGKTDAALAAVEASHAAAPDRKEITAELIDLDLRAGRKDDALALARAATGPNHQDHVLLMAVRARVETALELYNDAAQTCRRLIELAPQQIAYQRQLAAVLVAAKDYSGARQAIDEAMKIAPENAQLAEDRIAIDQAADGVAAAVETARQLAQAKPTLPTATALEGDAYFAGGDHAKALEAYIKAFEQHPSTLLAMRLARARVGAGQTDAAAAGLRDWVGKHPDDAAATKSLASFDIQAHKFPDATHELEALVAKTPDDPVVLNNLAWLYQQAGDQRARAVAQQAYLLAPALPQTADTLGWILVEQGEAANAIGLLQQARADEKASPAIRYHLAVALSAVGRGDEARQILTGLLKGTTTFDDKPAAEKLLAELSKK